MVEGRLWMLFDHYLSMRTWSRDFVASSAKVNKTLAWIRLPSLNLAFYDEEVHFTLANAARVPVRIDYNTLKAMHGKFSRVCVELDLTKPVVGRVKVSGIILSIKVCTIYVLIVVVMAIFLVIVLPLRMRSKLRQWFNMKRRWFL